MLRGVNNPGRCCAAADLVQQSVLTSRTWFTELQGVYSNSGEANSTDKHRAREIATFNRLRENRNSRPRGMFSPFDDASEMSTTAASCPWNLSTVPTRALGGSTALSRLTCML